MSSVQSLDRAFALLRVLGQRGEASVGELSLATGLPKPTVSRLMAAMLANGAVQRIAGGPYSIGDEIRSLASDRPSLPSLEDLARPHLVELEQHLGEDVGLATLRGRQVVYGRTFATEATVTIQPWEGEAAPLHAVAAGYVFLAAMSDEDVATYCAGGLPALGPKTLTSVEEVMMRVEQVRQDGYCWTHEEWAEGIDGAAAPVRRGEVVVAAINVYGPSYRFGDSGSLREVGERLNEVGSLISSHLERDAS